MPGQSGTDVASNHALLAWGLIRDVLQWEKPSPAPVGAFFVIELCGEGGGQLGGQLVAPGLDPGGIVFLRDFDIRVGQEIAHILNRVPGQQQLDPESIAQLVRVKVHRPPLLVPKG